MIQPETYIKYSKITREGVQELLNEIKGKVDWNEHEHVLDVGCGPGDITAKEVRHYLPKNSTVVGADISEKMIEYAQNHFASKNLTFQNVDITEQQCWKIWRKEEFTKIFSFFCLHQVDNQRNAYQNIYKLLKPGGELISIVVVDFDWNEVQKYLANNPEYAGRQEELLAQIPKESFAERNIKLLESIGFEIKFDTIRKKQYIFRSIDDAYEFFESINHLPNILANRYVMESMIDAKYGSKDAQIIQMTDKGLAFRYVLHSFVAKKPANESGTSAKYDIYQ